MPNAAMPESCEPKPDATAVSGTTGSHPARWVDLHGDALFRYARLRLGSTEQAEELVQETFLEALRVRDSFRGRSSERTWLIGILRHKLLDHFRREARRRAASGARDAPYEGRDLVEFDDRGHWRSVPVSWSDPGADLDRAEFWTAFRRCLDELPPGLARAFALRELEGIDGPTACELLGISAGNLWARLHRARLGLRRCLQSRWFGEKPDRLRDDDPSGGPP